MMPTNETRREIEERLLYGLSLILPKDKFEELSTLIRQMPEDVFRQYCAECATKAPDPNSFTFKDFINMVREGREKFGVTPLNRASVANARFMASYDNNRLWERISKSSPSDVIKLTRESDSKIIHLWEDSNPAYVTASGVSIPSDLFFAETIPLKDVKIIVDERGSEPGGALVSYRVVIFDDYAYSVRRSDENTPSTVGAVVQYVGKRDERSIAYPINVIRGLDVVVSGMMGYRNIPSERRHDYEATVSEAFMGQGFISMLETWYGIQIALLHPLVKDVFRKPRTVAVYGSSRKTNRRQKRRVKYVKEHVINSDEVEKALYGGNHGITRRTLVWYVIGHWRKYADGRKVFVKPYWKGALRELKRNLTDREREIAQISEDAPGILKGANG